MATYELPAFCRSRPLTALFLVSLLGLFLQVMLIRWVGTEVRIFAYLQNTILIACFLGLGLGCFTCRQPIRLGWTAGSLAILSGLLAFPPARALLHLVTDWLGPVAHSLAWVGYDGDRLALNILELLGGVAVLFALLTLLCVCFVPLGQVLGRLMSDHPRVIVAYSVNIVGSLVGVWLFAALSYWYMPPAVWAVLAVLFLAPFLLPFRRPNAASAALALAFVALTFVAGREPDAVSVHWSPYQKLALEVVDLGHEPIRWIKVNNVGYQQMIDRRPDYTARNTAAFPPEQQGLTQYDLPLKLHRRPRRVLIAGAGSGNDAAGCLRNGAEQVTAVEIDPAIIRLGKAHHPERPYDSDKVRVVVDDARSFFAGCQEKFDLVIFGLLDSHTTTALTNARLDHYVYTRESFRQARRLLEPDGLMAVTFAPQHDYIVDRMARVLRDEFGAAPDFFEVPHNNYGFGGVMFLAGNLDGVKEQLDAQPHLRSLIERWRQAAPWHERVSYTAPVATDDWPYLYLPRPTVPFMFVLIALVTVLVLATVRRLFRMPALVTGPSREHWHFALLGAAFLLLETQNISKASVVLGNTWLVSAVIISGVLCMILLANLIAYVRPGLPLGPVGAALCATCVGLYFLDIGRFAFYPMAVKAVLVGGLTTLPMLFSGILFIRSFQLTDRKEEAMGANLIGSLVGGLLQALTFLTGTGALLLLVAGLYAAAVALAPRDVRAEAAVG
ncbi:MAG: methyltransferase domain-containing protein [Gemmataceae bacterium]